MGCEGYPQTRLSQKYRDNTIYSCFFWRLFLLAQTSGLPDYGHAHYLAGPFNRLPTASAADLLVTVALCFLATGVL